MNANLYAFTVIHFLDKSSKGNLHVGYNHILCWLGKVDPVQAHICPSADPEEVEAVMSILLENNKIRHAAHNIMAYRIDAQEKGIYMQDYDDDGEAAAGGRLLHLLQVPGHYIPIHS